MMEDGVNKKWVGAGLFSFHYFVCIGSKVATGKSRNQRYECLIGIPPNQRYECLIGIPRMVFSGSILQKRIWDEDGRGDLAPTILSEPRFSG